MLPKMIAYLDAHPMDENWSQDTWDDLVLKFLSRTLDTIGREEWILQVGEALGKHYALYPGDSGARNMVSKALGVVMRKATKRGVGCCAVPSPVPGCA